MTIDHAIDLMLDGYAAEAAQFLEKDTESASDQYSRAALGCAYALQNQRQEAERLLLTDYENPQANVVAIRSAGLAYLAMRDGDMEKFKELMEKAIEADSTLPLPWLSLGLYYQWQTTDFDRAREKLNVALNIKPDSHLVHRHLIGLEASTGNLELASRLLQSLPKSLQGTGAPITLPLMLWLASTPLKGRLAMLFLVALTFVPYLGPILIVSWLLLSIVTYRQLVRISIRLAVLPGIYLVAMLASFVLKWLITGSIFP